MPEITLASDWVEATVSPTAGMLVNAIFTIDGRTHHPFARAPWIGEAGLDDQPGHLRMLGAEFVAVPFGSVGAPARLSPAWQSLVPAENPERPHGRSADEDWSVVESRPDRVSLALDYPKPAGISRVERTITLRPGAAAIDFTLTLHARETVSTAVGLHPILRLPVEPGALELDVDFSRGFTYPGYVWPGVGPTLPGSTFVALDAVPARDGGAVDLSRLPLGSGTEDVVLLADVRGPLVARFRDEGTRVRLDWDRRVIPHLMLWLSDGVLAEEPWNRRYRGLGVEPIAAAFDFDNVVSTHPNPLTDAGHVTSVLVTPGRALHIEYSVEVSSVDQYV